MYALPASSKAQARALASAVQALIRLSLIGSHKRAASKSWYSDSISACNRFLSVSSALHFRHPLSDLPASGLVVRSVLLVRSSLLPSNVCASTILSLRTLAGSSLQQTLLHPIRCRCASDGLSVSPVCLRRRHNVSALAAFQLVGASAANKIVSTGNRESLIAPHTCAPLDSDRRDWRLRRSRSRHSACTRSPNIESLQLDWQRTVWLLHVHQLGRVSDARVAGWRILVSCRPHHLRRFSLASHRTADYQRC